MSKLLSIDDMLEAARESGMFNTISFVEQFDIWPDAVLEEAD